ncbi:hypothetical protein ABPG72_000322 [Tetrahymena utriculariae]
MNAGRTNQRNKPMTGLINDKKEKIDPYLPRKCDWSNKLVFSNDQSSVQIAIAEVGENGQATGSKSNVVLCGSVRSKGEAHIALENILRERGLYPIKE